MRKKVLIIATVVKTHICAFHLPYIEMFHNRGYETYVAAKNDCGCGNGVPEIPFCDHFIDIPFSRNPASPQNITAYRRLKKLLCENHFDIVQYNTPIGGALGRLTARKARKNGTRCLYRAWIPLLQRWLKSGVASLLSDREASLSADRHARYDQPRGL